MLYPLSYGGSRTVILSLTTRNGVHVEGEPETIRPPYLIEPWMPCLVILLENRPPGKWRADLCAGL